MFDYSTIACCHTPSGLATCRGEDYTTTAEYLAEEMRCACNMNITTEDRRSSVERYIAEHKRLFGEVLIETSVS